MAVILPPELILACLERLSSSDADTIPTLLNFGSSSRANLSLSRSPALWRPITQSHYPPRYTSQTSPAACDDTNESDPLAYFAGRALKNRRAREIVRDLLKPLNRLAAVDELRGSLGTDVVDELGKPAAFTEEKRPETWLSLQFWAREARRTLLVEEALRVWSGIVQRDEAGEEAPDDFERGLNCFAAFRGLDPAALSRTHYDLSHHPRLVEATSHPPYEGSQRLEWLSTEVVDYMTSIGIRPAADGSFHDLDNHLVALRMGANGADAPYGTLPMTLVAIFCSLFRRLPIASELSIRAKPVGFPGTVLAGLSYEGSDEWVYVNVFAKGKILSRETMTVMLRAMGATPTDGFFQPASAREMSLRVARNILTSVQQGERVPGEPISHKDTIESLYSVAHALHTLVSSRDVDQAEVETYADWLVSLVQAEYPLDVAYLEKRILPLQTPERKRRMQGLCKAIREDDASRKEEKPVSAAIRWKIGHIFRHRLFGYVAVVRGWDYTCEASEQWIRQMRVDTLPYGRNQPFYHVIVEDGSVRYVANENITATPIDDDEADAFLDHDTIGKYFRKRERQEDQRWAFVPSQDVEAEYPDS